MFDLSFYKGKRVFITGHTGFKGTWLCCILAKAGAFVTGFSKEPPTDPSLFQLSGIASQIHSVIGDVRDLEALQKAFNESDPEIVFHLAAQPLVIDSYQNPVYTYETNVMGTVHILECIRHSKSVHSFLNVTTDKVYENDESGTAFTEDQKLNGYDPYSNSKSCSELVTYSYNQSFLKEKGIAVSTARAGNVIGGGEFAANRIIPDCVRAAIKKEAIIVRNPNSIRPFQHVLEPLFVYLMIAQRQAENADFAGCYNVGPDDSDCVTTGELAELFCREWGEGQTFLAQMKKGPHEASYLKLDCTKLKNTFNWRPHFHIQEAIQMTVAFSKVYAKGQNVRGIMDLQIDEMLK